MNKTKILIILTAIGIVFLVALSLISGSRNTPTDNSVDSTSLMQKENSDNNISSVLPPSVLEGIKSVSTSETTKRFITNENYIATYYPTQNEILVVINSSPFEDVKVIAEEDLKDTLDLSEEELCTIHVSITTPRHINPDEAGVIHDLSFCEDMP